MISNEQCMRRMDRIYRATLKEEYMKTSAPTSVTCMEIHEEGELSGASVDENAWCFEISNKSDYLKSGSSILRYQMEVFVPAWSMSKDEHAKLKVTVKQVIYNNDPSPLPGNRQLGPIIRLEADQAHVQFVRPLLAFMRFPDEFLKHTDDYEYCVQYNSGKDIHRGIWNDITGYREGQVSSMVIPSHQTAVLLLHQFSWFTIFRRCKLLNVELYAHHLQQQDNYQVLVTCLAYLKPLHGTADHKEESKCIKGQYQTSETMALTKNDNVQEVVLVGHQDEAWHLEHEELGTQKIQIQPLLRNNFMKKNFVFEGQGQSSFSCNIEVNIPGCSAKLRVLMPLQECDQAVISPSAEQCSNAPCDSVQSVPPVINTKSLADSISSSFLQHLTDSERAELRKRHTSVIIQKILNSNRVNLTDNMLVDDYFWNHLIEKDVLSMRERDNIKAKCVGYEQASAVIDLVHDRPDSYEAFRESLCESNQQHLVACLPPMYEPPQGQH